MKGLNVNFPASISKFESAMKKRLLIKTAFYKRVLMGRGLEFESFRPYTQNDDSSLIDWKASMKTQDFLVRHYVEERDLKVFFIIDTGESMCLGSGEKLKNEAAAEIAASLAHLVIISGDSIGFAFYSSDVLKLQNFSGGMKQFYSFIKNLSSLEVYRGKSNLEKALRLLFPYLKGASAVFIISDFMRIDEGAEKILKQFSSKYETIGIMVKDPVDVRMPDLKREVVIEDIYTGEQLLINPALIKHKYEVFALEGKRKTEEIFKKTGSDLLEINTGQDFVNPLAEFLRSRIKSTRKKR